jgi:hypothetical protein
MSNYYAWKYPATPHEFRIAVPPDKSCKEFFQIAGIAFTLRIDAWRIRNAIFTLTGEINQYVLQAKNNSEMVRKM